MYALKSAWETAVFESIALNEIACIIIVDLLLRQGAIARGSCVVLKFYRFVSAQKAAYICAYFVEAHILGNNPCS
jgi:hypothetical protein